MGRNTFGCSSAAILGRKRARTDIECDTSIVTSPFDSTPLILVGGKEGEEDTYDAIAKTAAQIRKRTTISEERANWCREDEDDESSRINCYQD